MEAAEQSAKSQEDRALAERTSEAKTAAVLEQEARRAEDRANEIDPEEN